MGVQVGSRAVTGIMVGSTTVVAVYRGSQKVWPSDSLAELLSCFGLGYWVDDMPWTDDEAWKD